MPHNGITDPSNPNFVPYYERRGTAAEGVAVEWLEQKNRSEEEILSKYPPRDRDELRRMSQASIIGEFQNLQRFEQREVRRGRLMQLEDTLAKQGANITASIMLQHRSIREGVDATLADAVKTHADAVRALPEGNAERTRMDKWLENERKEAATDYSGQLAGLVTQTNAKIMMAEPLIDAAVADGLLSPEEGAARKRTAARAAYTSVFKTLVSEGQLEAAEAFVSALEARPVTNPDGSVVTDGNGLPEVEDSPAASLYGFTTEEVSALRGQTKALGLQLAAAARERRAEERRAIDDNVKRRQLEIFGSSGDMSDYFTGLDSLGRDPDLQREYPERALALRMRAKKGLAALLKEKELADARDAKAKARDEKAAARAVARAEKQRRADVLEDLKRQAEYLLVPPSDDADEKTEAQYARDKCALAEQVEAAFTNGWIDADDFSSLRSKMSKSYDADEAWAVRHIHQVLGFDRGLGLDTPGEVQTYLKNNNKVELRGQKLSSDEVSSLLNIGMDEFKALRREHPTANMRDLARKAGQVVAQVFAEREASEIIEMLMDARKYAAEADSAMHSAVRPVAMRLYPSKAQIQADDEARRKREAAAEEAKKRTPEDNAKLEDEIADEE